jgi:Rrf2 family transcriptional regulator, cysteine metabolism repressor
MKISAKAEYACLAMLALARRRVEDPPVRIREIAEEEEIPERYLVQILLQLKGAGLVESTRGASGGYRLSRPPQRISIHEVLTAIDGPVGPERENKGGSSRALVSIWNLVRDAEKSVLQKISVAEVADRASPREWII